MSGAATITDPKPERAWEVTGADSALAGELASQALPKPPVEIIEVSSLAQIGAALDRLQRAECFEVQLRFMPTCPDEVVHFAFNLPKSISQAIMRYNEIIAEAGKDPTKPSYGLAVGNKPPMIVLSIDPRLGSDATLNKRSVIDLSSIDQASASDAAQNLARILEISYASSDNQPRIEVRMPTESTLYHHVCKEMLETLYKPVTGQEEEQRRLQYLRKRLELLDLIVNSVPVRGNMLLD